MKLYCEWRDRVVKSGESAPELREHLLSCASCRALWEQLASVDARVDRAGFAGLSATACLPAVPPPDAFPVSLRGPSLIPELLDGVGWAAAIWIGAFLLNRIVSGS
jgi:hypothetical protein